MSYLNCPLCGKLCHMNSFSPERYDDDIIVVEMQSLGRGRGFEKTAEYSGLGDEVLMGRISKRLKRLLQVIDGDSLDSPERGLLEDQLEEFEDETQAIKTELDMARIRIRELEALNEESESLDELLSRINDALSITIDEDFGDIESAVGALIDGYHDAVEEAEDLA